jgi:hypothetical protein
MHISVVVTDSLLANSPCLFELFIDHGTIFFSHNKSVSTDLSAAKTTGQTARKYNPRLPLDMEASCSWESPQRVKLVLLSSFKEGASDLCPRPRKKSKDKIHE